MSLLHAFTGSIRRAGLAVRGLGQHRGFRAAPVCCGVLIGQLLNGAGRMSGLGAGGKEQREGADGEAAQNDC